MLGGPVTAGPGFGGLDEQIDRLDTAVGEPGIERVIDDGGEKEIRVKSVKGKRPLQNAMLND